ncbi:MAG TPA: hypothetical protein PKO18_03460 [Chitinophagales bacterium]|nr:hypothetical protein [Chitinophagales bacterium]
MKSTNIIFSSVLLFLSLLTSSCVSSTSDTDPIPTTTFDVNLFADAGSTNDTIIAVDGDSIAFQYISGVVNSDYHYYLVISSNQQNFEILDSKEYPYNLTTNQYDSTQSPIATNTLNEGVLINDAYTAYPWVSFIHINLGLKPYLSISTLDIRLSGWGLPGGYRYGMKKNIEQYIVLRKLKGSQHQYYWIKIRQDPNGSSPGFKVLNGKYQLNSITTGL